MSRESYKNNKLIMLGENYTEKKNVKTFLLRKLCQKCFERKHLSQLFDKKSLYYKKN